MENAESVSKYVFSKLSEAPLIVKNRIYQKGEKLKTRNVYFRIQEHLEPFIKKAINETKENRWLVLPGLRGVGKTTLLLQIYYYLRDIHKIPQEQILYFTTDELRAYLSNSIRDVIETFIEEVHDTTPAQLDKDLFILIDEAQFDKEWAKTAKIFYEKSDRIFFIFTGSSALDLEKSVDSMRRKVNEKIFPMNFAEYLLLKYSIYPPNSFSESLRKLIFVNSRESVELSNYLENQMRRNSLKLGNSLEKEWKTFLCYGGFPFGLHTKGAITHQKIFGTVNKIIEKDVPSHKSFRTETKNLVSRILMFLASKKSGEVSDNKLSTALNTSPTTVREILDVLEKTHIIFSVKPYGGAGKKVRGAWKYYFLSPSINAAIQFKLGTFNNVSREYLGVLAENLVAASFFKIKETMEIPSGIFYDSRKGGVDFILQNAQGEIIPVEVGLTKSKKQISNAISKYNAKYGIVISNCEKISKEDMITFIPLTTFSFL